MVEEKAEKMETNETEEKDSAKTPPEWKLSNLDREKATTTIDKEGIPKFVEQGRTKSDNATQGVVKVEGFEDEDLNNPYIYAAFANAGRASIEFTHPAPDVPNKNWAAYKHKKALRLQFKNDANARMMTKNLLHFVRTPGRELTITRFVNSGKEAAYRKDMELDGKVFDVPRPMRSLIVRGVPDAATIKQIVKAVSTREADLEVHELRKDARGKQCAVLCFKDAAKAITVMQRTEGKATVGDAEVLVYYMAAGMFYDNLLHYSEAEGRDIEAAYANLMHGVSRANNPSQGELAALKRAGASIDGGQSKKAKGPMNLTSIKPAAPQRPRFVAEGANPAQAKRQEAMAKYRNAY